MTPSISALEAKNHELDGEKEKFAGDVLMFYKE